MTHIFQKKNQIQSILFLLAMVLPTYTFAAEDNYVSQLVNQSNHSGSNGFKLVRSKLWPNAACILDSGKAILNPGETTDLKIKKSKECEESGIGYSIYKLDDTKNEHLLGFLSHRLGEGKFSVQVSRFCEGSKCVFTDLNPEQNRENSGKY